ncbi:MAG: PIN domain-containing protein [Nanoarchaeota archaeon]
MLQKRYADTDFFLALMKNSDWLKEKAKQVYEKDKNLFVSPFTIAEIMIICKREDILMKETLIQISRIAKLENMDWNIFFNSCNFIEKGTTIFDSLLMALVSENDLIISSDNVYEKFGFKVIDLKKN